MIHKDFIMKLLELFFISLEKWLHRPKEEQLALFEEFKTEMYDSYLKQPPIFFESKDYSQTIAYFENTYDDQKERLARIEILSELLYLEIQEKATDMDFLLKVSALFTYIDQRSKTFSMTRVDQLNQIQKLLNR